MISTSKKPLAQLDFIKGKAVAITVVATSVIIVGLYIFVYRPLITKLKVAYSETKAVEAALRASRDSAASLSVPYLTKELAKKQDIPLIIEDLTQQGVSEGINFLSIVPKEIEEKEASYKILPIEIEIESPFKILANYLGSLDDFEQSLIVVKSFVVRLTDKDKRKLDAKISLAVYLRNEE
jgi:Tfp pilus assembly protein PilO